MSTEESKKLLKRHVNNKTNLVIMFVDMNNSTEMSLSLPENKFALLVQCFAQEISLAVLGYGGYVFSKKVMQLSCYFQQNTTKEKHVKMH